MHCDESQCRSNPTKWISTIQWICQYHTLDLVRVDCTDNYGCPIQHWTFILWVDNIVVGSNNTITVQGQYSRQTAVLYLYCTHGVQDSRCSTVPISGLVLCNMHTKPIMTWWVMNHESRIVSYESWVMIHDCHYDAVYDVICWGVDCFRSLGIRPIQLVKCTVQYNTVQYSTYITDVIWVMSYSTCHVACATCHIVPTNLCSILMDVWLTAQPVCQSLKFN